MANFLIDVNLPYYFSLWNNPDYVHQKDIEDSWADSQIWNYAKENNLTIVNERYRFPEQNSFVRTSTKSNSY